MHTMPPTQLSVKNHPPYLACPKSLAPAIAKLKPTMHRTTDDGREPRTVLPLLAVARRDDVATAHRALAALAQTSPSCATTKMTSIRWTR